MRRFDAEPQAGETAAGWNGSLQPWRPKPFTWAPLRPETREKLQRVRDALMQREQGKGAR